MKVATWFCALYLGCVLSAATPVEAAVPSAVHSRVGKNAVTSADDAELSTLREAMIANIREQLARRVQVGPEGFSIEMDYLKIEPRTNLTGLRSVQVLGLGTFGAKRIEGLFSLPVMAQIARDGRLEEIEIQVSGVLKVVGPVYVARSNLQRGHIIEKQDLLVTTMPWKTLAQGSFGFGQKELLGLSVKAMVDAGQPFNLSQLDQPAAVKSGELVEVTVLSGPGVIIRSRGIARQEGRVGDFIRIEQPDTKKSLSGMITGEKSVEVRL